jgi:hypothetical protein
MTDNEIQQDLTNSDKTDIENIYKEVTYWASRISLGIVIYLESQIDYYKIDLLYIKC